MYICVDLAYLNSFGSRNRFLFFFFWSCCTSSLSRHLSSHKSTFITSKQTNTKSSEITMFLVLLSLLFTSGK